MSQMVPKVSGLSRLKIEGIANGIIRQHFPSMLLTPSPFPVMKLFEDVLRDVYQLDPGAGDLPPGVEGMAYPDGRVMLSEDTYRGACRNDGRSRFTVAHECFHGIQHCRQLKSTLVHIGSVALYRRDSEVAAYADPEWQANEFAGAILMPWETVKTLLPTYVFNLPELLKDKYQVSYTAAKTRITVLKKMGRLKE